MSRTKHNQPRRHIDLASLKAEARSARRAADRALLDALRTGDIAPEDADGWTRSSEVSNRWRHD